MSINRDSSIELRKNIYLLEDEINNYRTELNIINAKKRNINNIDYNFVKNTKEYELSKKIRYYIFFLLLFYILNLIIIKKSKQILLFIICFLILIIILFYRKQQLKQIDNYIINLKNENENNLIEFNNRENEIYNKILVLKKEITDLYNSLKLISISL